MVSAVNQTCVAELNRKIVGHNSVFIVGYSGLDVSIQERLRRQLHSTDEQMCVYKNTLMNIAFKESQLSIPDTENIFVGQSAIVFCKENPVQMAKVICEFAKKNKQFVIKGGFVEKEFMNGATIKALSLLPSREQLLSMVVAGIQGPLSGLVRVLNGPIQNLLYSLEAIKNKRNSD